MAAATAAAANDAAKTPLDVSNARFQAGYVNQLALLRAEQSYHQASINNQVPRACSRVFPEGGWRSV